MSFHVCTALLSVFLNHPLRLNLGRSSLRNTGSLATILAMRSDVCQACSEPAHTTFRVPHRIGPSFN